jgi:hypothetical protein
VTLRSTLRRLSGPLLNFGATPARLPLRRGARLAARGLTEHSATAEAASADPAVIAEEPAAFDRDWYLGAYPDVAAAGVDPLEHYRAYGKGEGRHPTLAAAEQAIAFVRDPYPATCADVAAGIDPFKHCMAHVKREGHPTPHHYVFVAGCGHTGTTLMATMLGCHSEIFTVRDELELFRGTSIMSVRSAGIFRMHELC